MKKVYLIILALVGTSSIVYGDQRGYQRTLDRAQMGRSRRMMYRRSDYMPETHSMTGRRLGGPSLMRESQQMQAENLAADMSSGM